MSDQKTRYLWTLALMACTACGSAERRVPVEVAAPAQCVPDSGQGRPGSSYMLLNDQPTTGRFGASLAIAMVNDPAEVAAADLRITPMSEAEQSYWLEATRGLPALREALFLTPLDTRAERPGLAGVLRAADRRGAALLLVYARKECPGNRAKLCGVLYDTKASGPLATLRSAEARPIPDDADSLDELRGDHRTEDAGWRASRSFEAVLRDCINELTWQDTPAPTTQPHRWNAGPPEGLWIPVRR